MVVVRTKGSPFYQKQCSLVKFHLSLLLNIGIYLYLLKDFTQVFQSEFFRETEPTGCAFVQEEVYYKELAHRLWKLALLNIQCRMAGWRSRKSPCYRSSLKASRIKTQEELMFRFRLEGREKTQSSCSRQLGRRNTLLLSLSVPLKVFNRLNEAHSLQGEQLVLLSLAIQC